MGHFIEGFDNDPLLVMCGGRGITKAINAKLAELTAAGWQDITLELGTPIRLHGHLEDMAGSFDVEPVAGIEAEAWGQLYDLKRGTSIAVMLTKAEAMFDWPIYRAATVVATSRTAWAAARIAYGQEEGPDGDENTRLRTRGVES